jgi:hypothetical protein
MLYNGTKSTQGGYHEQRKEQTKTEYKEESTAQPERKETGEKRED